MSQLWEKCLNKLESDLDDTDLNIWIRPLQAFDRNKTLDLLAPNRFVMDQVENNYLTLIQSLVDKISGDTNKEVRLVVGSQPTPSEAEKQPQTTGIRGNRKKQPLINNNLSKNFTFDTFVEGKTNQMARASAIQVAKNPGEDFYNPLFIYGGVGLGKTHLMHAIGNNILKNDKNARVVYLHSERFVADMVSALQHNAIDHFKNYYRSLNALLIDDIQFFAGKERSQEEFFHTFNALLEGQQQVILTSDRYPKEVDGLEERLKSRFGWGLTTEIKPPELETRVAILQKKAFDHFSVELPSDVAFFIAKHVRSNIRELEGALRRIMAGSKFMGAAITMDYVKETLHDLLSLHNRMITLENIQKTVVEYYKIRSADLLSKKRNRSIARPRQVAMALSKELTQHSLPEIGDAFGGRDHTTVLHACRKIKELKTQDSKIAEDYENLLRRLTT